MRRFRLATVLRARQVQEDVARAAVMSARAEAEEASAGVQRMELVLSSRGVPASTSPGAFVAALCARQSMAADLSAARAVAARAGETVNDRLGDLTAASVRRRGVERLAERHVELQRHAEEAAAQLEIDDLATTARLRNRRPAD